MIDDSWYATYDRYRAALTRALTRRGDKAAALAAEDEFDAAWDRASRALPPASSLGQVCLTSRARAFFLHAVGRQAVWPDEKEERATRMVGEFLLGRALARVEAAAGRYSPAVQS